MLKISLHFAWRSFSFLTRVALLGGLLLAFALAGGVLTLRYWVLPDIGRYHDTIVSTASRLVGQPVEIDRIEADWEGIGPHLRLSDIRILNQQHAPVLALQRVDLVVSWMTLLAGELRLASLEVDRPELLIRRDAQGALQISGIPLTYKVQAESAEATGSDFANLLLQQARIVVRDAHISWLDEKNAAPLLEFRDVNLLIRNSWNHHRFAMRALPPAQLSTRLDVRGDLFGSTVADPASWSGEIYTRLDYADVAAWKTWVPLPASFKRGQGALRGWLGIENGQISHVTADLALENVQTRLADDVPALEIRTLRGRVGWRDLDEGFEFSTRALAFRLFNGFELKPTSVLLSLGKAGAQPYGRGEVRANLLELSDFNTLMEFLPLERQLKQQLAEYAPSGRVENLLAQWDSAGDQGLRYELRARFNQLALRRVGNLPGFSGLSGEVDGNESGGTLSINARNLKLDAPQFLPEALAFDSVTAQSSWESYRNRLEVKLSNVSVVNDDLAGSAFGSYQTADNSPGKIDLTVHLTHASVPRIHRYIPLLALGGDARTWMSTSLQEGKSGDASLRLQGDLNDFPYADNKKGIFKVHARAKGVAVDYAQGWPRVDNATVNFLLQGKQMEITVPSATTAGARVQRVSVSIPDILSDDLLLQVRGEQEGDIARCLDYIQKSPVRGYLSGFTNDVTASGNGKLSLQLDIPLSGSQPVKASGSYHFAGHEVDFGKHMPTLHKVAGDLLFSESGVSTKNITAQVLGGPASLVVETGAEGAISARLNGTANFDALRKQRAHPLLHRLQGSVPWDVDMRVQGKLSQITLNSNLTGLQSDLPAPLNKRAGDNAELHVVQSSQDARHETLALQYGAWLNAKFSREADASGNWDIKRGKVMFGNVAKSRDRDGIWLLGTLPLVSLEGWGGVSGGGSGDIDFDIAGANLQIQKLTGYGSTVNNLHVSAATQDGVLKAQISAREVNGELSWLSDDNGKLLARLKYLNLGEADKTSAPEKRAGDTAVPPGRVSEPAAISNDISLPALDLVIERLSVKGRPLGKFELQAQQQEHDYLLQSMRLSNPDSMLTADGRWKMQAGEEQTKVNLKLEVSNAGNILARYGYPDSVKNGSGKLEGNFSWPGAPEAFSYAVLDGTLRLDTGKGQFLQVDPGAGKLLSIMSLQALPRHLTLDFNDVIRKGFEFESISGTASIHNGLMQTNDFKVEGSAAKVLLTGQVDLNQETQNLRVKVLPAVGSSVSLLSFAAGPTVGVGVYLANKLLRDPLDKLVAFEYNVTGGWVNPKVEKVGGDQPAATLNPTE